MPSSSAASPARTWRGDSDNVMMTRIYAWAFGDKAALDEAVGAFELAQERDHKKLGRELDLFTFDDAIGRGLPLWMPHGTVIRDELEKLAIELEFRAGYQRVATPHIAKGSLYRANRSPRTLQGETCIRPMEVVEETPDGKSDPGDLHAETHELPAPPQDLRGPAPELPRTSVASRRVWTGLPLGGIRARYRVSPGCACCP